LSVLKSGDDWDEIAASLPGSWCGEVRNWKGFLFLLDELPGIWLE
jgi:hypothetical protein